MMLDIMLLKYTDGDTVDDLGQPVFDHTQAGQFKGYLDMLSGDETDTNKALNAESTHVIITDDVLVDIDEMDRVQVGSKTYEVTYVDNPMELGHHLEIFVKRVVDQ